MAAFTCNHPHLSDSESEGSMALVTTTGASVADLPDNPITVSEGLWLQPDSLVIFQTEHLIYCLPHNIFSQKSSLLQDFLESPHLVSTDFERGLYVVDGLPLIKLLGVSSEEGEIFLKALYDAEYFEPPPSRTSLKIVLAVLRLATKYGIQFLRRRALGHLALAYPTRLDEWDSREVNSTFPIDPDYGNFMSSTLSETLMVIQTAEECHAPWVLPTAFYECCRYNLKGLLDHPMWVDGTIAHELKTTILVGFMNQVTTTPKALGFLLLRPLDGLGCEQNSVCSEARRTVQEEALQWSFQQPLDIWEEADWSNDNLQTHLMCELCLTVCKKVHQDHRNIIWKALPEVFDLPDWEVLVASQAAAMVQ